MDLGAEAALCVADAALHRNVVTSEGITASIGTDRPLTKRRRALWVGSFADPRIESPGGSIARLRFAEAGIDPPEPQFVVRDATGLFLAWVDFAWPDARAVLEFDGLAKYSIRGDGPRASAREKAREDALRAAG